MKKIFLHASIIFLATYQASGYTAAVIKWTPNTFSYVLAQYTQPSNMAGLIDQTFGAQGIVTTDVTPTHDSWINSCVLQQDGK